MPADSHLTEGSVSDQPYPPLRPQQPIRPRRRTTPLATIIAVVLLVILAAILAVALLGDGGGSPGESGEPSAASSSPAESVSASPGGSTGPTASASAGTGGGFAPDAIVAIVVEALTLRETAGLEGDAVWRLPEGTMGFVIEGPVEADGLTWYELSGMGLPYASGCITPEPGGLLEACPAWLGWVAAAAEDGTAYLAPAADPQCPDPPPTIESLSEMQSTLRLICLDAEPLTFRAWWPEEPDDQGQGATCPAEDTELAWLACPNTSDNGLNADPSDPGRRLTVSIDPASGVSMPARGQWVELTGHFDDPAAQRCAEVAELMGSDAGAVVFTCRLQFVVTAAAPTTGP